MPNCLCEIIYHIFIIKRYHEILDDDELYEAFSRTPKYLNLSKDHKN